MLFEQNIASNVTRNVTYKTKTQARPSTPKQLLGTHRNLLNLKEQEIFDFQKKS